MAGQRLLDFCPPPWPIDDLGFLLPLLCSFLVSAHLGKWAKPNEGVISWRAICQPLLCHISRGLKTHPKECVFMIRLRFQSWNRSVMMIFSVCVSPLRPKVAGGLVQ